MPNRVVVGAQWGDEGKAKIVDFLTEEADMVIRFQGGANAGHTVEVGDQKFVFHLIPAGIMHPGKQCVIGNGVVLDPAQILHEIEEVRARGINLDGRLWVAENAQVVLPYHKLLDQLKEKAAGKAAIGTTGRGIGPAYYDKANRSGVRVGDLLEEHLLRDRIRAMGALHNDIIQKVFGGEPLPADAIFEEYRDLGRKLAPFVKDTVALDQPGPQGRQAPALRGRPRHRSSTWITAPTLSSPRPTPWPPPPAWVPASGPPPSTRCWAWSKPIPPGSATDPSPPRSRARSARSCAASATNTAPPRDASAAAAGSTPCWCAAPP